MSSGSRLLRGHVWFWLAIAIAASSWNCRVYAREVEPIASDRAASEHTPSERAASSSNIPSSDVPTSAASRTIGQVLDPSGQPIAGAKVRVLLNPYFAAAESSLVTSTRTDASGAFELFFPLPGRWNIAIEHDNYEPLTEEVWAIAGMTAPVDVVLQVPLEKRDRTRMGIVGAGGLEHTRTLSQQLAADTLRLNMVPNSDSVVLLDNRRLEPILDRIGVPLYELLERDRFNPAAVGEFFDYLGLKALVVARTDVLARSADAAQVELKSRSSLELWTFNDAGQLQISTVADGRRQETLDADLNAAEVEQLLQVQITKTAQAFGSRWQENNPLAAYFNSEDVLSPQEVRLDTTVRLNLPSKTTNSPIPEGETEREANSDEVNEAIEVPNN